jgi:hypothetical protein
MRIPPSLMTRSMGFVALAGMVACGGGGSGGGVDAGDPPGLVDANPDQPDATPPDSRICEQGGHATSNRYLPFDVGNTWRYRVDEGDGTPPAVKNQGYEELITPDAETGPVMVQTTAKTNGSTENWLQQQGDRIVRLRQQDFDELGNLERTTYYRPHRLRLDESPERLVAGATWTENYVIEERDPLDNLVSEETVSEEWLVAEVDVACPAPWEALKCIHLELDRFTGTQKSYWFARSYGKIRELSGPVEELLVGCTLQ